MESMFWCRKIIIGNESPNLPFQQCELIIHVVGYI